jgi:hypothetical protein
LPPWADDKYFFHLHEAMEMKNNADTQTQDSNIADKEAGLRNRDTRTQDPEITDKEEFLTKRESFRATKWWKRYVGDRGHS